MAKRKTPQKRLGVQDIAEILIERIDQLETVEGNATQTIGKALLKIEEQQNRKLQIDTTNYINISKKFLEILQKKHEQYLQNYNELLKSVTEQQNKVNQQTQKLNSELYEIQAEVKKLSKVGFGRLPNYLVAVLVGVFGGIILILLTKG